MNSIDASPITLRMRMTSLLGTSSAEFRAEVDAAVALAAEQPLRFPRKHKDIRCVRVRRFPYSVFFLQEESRIVGGEPRTNDR